MSQQLSTGILLIVFIVSGFGLLLGGILYSLYGPTSIQNRISRYVTSTDEEGRQSIGVSGQDYDRLNQLRSQMNTTLSVFSSEELQLKISSAYWSISDTEYILVRFLITFFGLAVGTLVFSNILGGIVMAVLLYMLPGFLLYRSIQNRQKKFQDQLLDVLILIRGAVQSGYSLLQSLGVVITEMKAPASEEFQRVVREVQIGLPLSEALLNLASRMESEDLHLVVTAIIINTQVGGNLSLMLNSATNTIRDRIHLFGEIRALTSYARYASYLLTFLPIITALIIFLITPEYFKSLNDSPITKFVFGYAVVSIIIGNVWLRKSIKINV